MRTDGATVWLVELTAVNKRYGGGPPVLVDVDLTVEPGAVVAVAGGNGSGKSTLLRILAGLSRPTSGTVSGRPPVVGYVPERFPAGSRMPAGAYLAHMGRIRGLSAGAAAARAAELLGELRLVGAGRAGDDDAGAAGARTPLRELSKGNAQKVAVAQALLVRPDLLVLDEPWSGLDASAHDVLAELIGRVARQGGSVVFTDHREAVRRTVASAVWELADGRLSAGRGSAATSAPTSQAVFRIPPADRVHGLAALGPAGTNLLQGTQDEDEMVVMVPRENCDALLLAALQRGWSVEEVRHT